MGPLFSQLGNALTQFAKSSGAKYIFARTIKVITKKL